MLRSLDLGLLGLPDLFEVGRFTLEFLDFVFDQREAPARGFVLLFFNRFPLDFQLDDAAVELVHLLRFRIDFHLDTSSRFVDQVDRLVGQETVGNVTMRKLGRGNDRRISDFHTMMHFVFLFQPAQDGNSAFDRRLVDQDFLKAALKCRVFFDVFAILVERGCADAMQLAPSQCRLEHVSGVHGPFGFARADHRVKLIDEYYGASFFAREFLENGFEPFLEFTAVLGARQQRSHVQAQNAFALQRFRHFFIDDALGEAFHDRGFADAGFAYQDGIVLGSALQDLDDATNFVVAADDWVKFSKPRALSQVERVFLKRFALPFGLLALDALSAAHGLNGLFEGFFAQAMASNQFADFALVVRQREQEQF